MAKLNREDSHRFEKVGVERRQEGWSRPTGGQIEDVFKSPEQVEAIQEGYDKEIGAERARSGWSRPTGGQVEDVFKSSEQVRAIQEGYDEQKAKG